jgi:hypothetical protein
MKSILVVLFCFSLAACGSNPTKQESVEFVQITDMASEGIFGKRLTLEDNYIVLNENGSVNGVWAGGAAVGTWEMREGFWCRTYTEFAVADFINDEDCHLLERSGNTIRGSRNRGSGASYLLNIK